MTVGLPGTTFQSFSLSFQSFTNSAAMACVQSAGQPIPFQKSARTFTFDTPKSLIPNLAYLTLSSGSC